MGSWGNWDETLILEIVVPVVLYWLWSGIYMMLGSVERYRLHSKKDENGKNLVSKANVVKGVLLNQIAQIVIVITLRFVNGSDDNVFNGEQSLISCATQFLTAVVVLDTWQYFSHRYFHENKFLYRHVHSWHHRLIVAYPFGALYNHPVEGLISDTIGLSMTLFISRMSPRVSIYFNCFLAIKVIDDHSGIYLPVNPLRFFFGNNSAFHDIHHQHYGINYNYAQPFFAMWDKILGTYMPFSVEKKRDNGGFEVRLSKDRSIWATISSKFGG